ncbi:MAG: uroporphyrin-III methyltransferase [Geminicoccaceae bacterium]|jgi:uncharacterized protein YeaO (DUF488 family)|nr:uroporphyrin-III methyltransferase [Geminicoccaceae bacterium]MCE3249464.1 uroporphyrin-III methyltransferase [Geminicoccaceae bacterium]MDF2780987.1 uroporphyrin-III methyltransferase [Geminicoccaceae bacterium]
MSIELKRAYDPPAKSDGRRVLVDRVWPRGIAKDDLEIDGWLKDLAPSTELRKWFGHDPEKWHEFKQRYFDELTAHAETVDALVAQASAGRVTLVFAARDREHNNAVALKEFLGRRLRR